MQPKYSSPSNQAQRKSSAYRLAETDGDSATRCAAHASNPNISESREEIAGLGRAISWSSSLAALGYGLTDHPSIGSGTAQLRPHRLRNG